MTDIRIAWDDAKDRANRRKHGIGFHIAARVFLDPLHLSRQDRIENGERRWQTIGMVDGQALLLVAHTAQEEDEDGTLVERIRIISARAATRQERRRYEQG